MCGGEKTRGFLFFAFFNSSISYMKHLMLMHFLMCVVSLGVRSVTCLAFGKNKVFFLVFEECTFLKKEKIFSKRRQIKIFSR